MAPRVGASWLLSLIWPQKKFGRLTHVTAQDYVKEVTEADASFLVVVHLYQDYVPECVRLNQVYPTPH